MSLELVLGIGPIIARKLANKGIKTRAQLTKAAIAGTVQLSKLTLLDLRYNIVRHIKRAVVKKYVEPYLPPNAVLVGSYAQEKPQMGDIDVLIIRPEGATGGDCIPPPFGNDLIIYRSSQEDQHVTSGIWKIPHARGLSERGLARRKASQVGSQGTAVPCPPRGGSYVIVDVFYATEDEKPFAMLHYQGPVTFNMRVRAVAKKLGYKLNQYGLTKVRADAPDVPALKSERDVLDFLGIAWKEPRDR